MTIWRTTGTNGSEREEGAVVKKKGNCGWKVHFTLFNLSHWFCMCHLSCI